MKSLLAYGAGHEPGSTILLNRGPTPTTEPSDIILRNPGKMNFSMFTKKGNAAVRRFVVEILQAVNDGKSKCEIVGLMRAGFKRLDAEGHTEHNDTDVREKILWVLDPTWHAAYGENEDPLHAYVDAEFPGIAEKDPLMNAMFKKLPIQQWMIDAHNNKPEEFTG